MAYKVNIPMGDVFLKDYKTGELIAFGKLMEMNIIELPNGSKEYQLYSDALETVKSGDVDE